MNKTVHFLKTAFPFLAVILLWRLSVPFWNPGGILALIPIFYYSFIKSASWFVFFAAVFCFLIDYKSDTLLYWTTIYCFFYAINGFQNFVDLTRQKNDGLLIFMGYFGASAALLSLIGWSGAGFIRAIWLFCWASVLYIPFTVLARKITDND
ncbi:MAG: hypothetical protein LBF37_03185 [Rickettsiales bacterium]|jgi:hypothetical protein|nr:hypothetical protein [Rickettsiales bacterium]